MKPALKILKAELKAEAAAIKTIRQQMRDVKAKQKGNNSVFMGLYWDAKRAGELFRYKHVLYCLERGTPMELIESNVREGNAINPVRLEKIRSQYDFTEVLEDEPAE